MDESENGASALRFSHLGVAVADIEHALCVYQEVFGYIVLSGPFDDPIQRVSVCFIGTGDPDDLIIELVSPLGNADSPVNKILAKGIGAYHVCYQVDDIDQTLSHVRARGCIVISRPVPAVAFDGRQIAWFYTPTRQLVEILER